MSTFKPTKKIAVIKQGGLGDQIICSTLIKEIRKFAPDSHITLFAGSSTVDYWRHNIYINRVTPIPSIYNMANKDGLDLSKIDSSLRDIVDEKFDILINPSHDTDYYLTGLIVQKIKAKRKICYFQQKNVYNGYNSNDYYDEHLGRPYFENVALYQSYLFEKIFNEEVTGIYDTDCFLSKIEQDCVDLSLGKDYGCLPLVGIHANGSSVYRMLSESQLVQICCLVQDLGAVPLILGSGAAKYNSNILNYTGNLPILVLAALVKRLSGVICVDSGVKHLAGIAEIPTVEISHIPLDLMHLNGPYVDDQYKYSAINFWAPKPGAYPHGVIYPLNGHVESDIASGKTLQSIDFGMSYDVFKSIIPVLV
jgi:ADP-heptose:LPS heptosyltransferase